MNSGVYASFCSDTNLCKQILWNYKKLKFGKKIKVRPVLLATFVKFEEKCSSPWNSIATNSSFCCARLKLLGICSSFKKTYFVCLFSLCFSSREDMSSQYFLEQFYWRPFKRRSTSNCIQTTPSYILYCIRCAKTTVYQLTVGDRTVG